MGVDSMRVAGGRCSPFLTGLYIMALIMLAYHYWSLSSTNSELLRQVDELNEQIKISVEERDQCITQRGNFDEQLKSCQDDVRATRVQLLQIDENISSCTKELKYYKQTDATKTATIESLKIDKKIISDQVLIKQEENKLLEEKLNETKEELEKVKLSLNEQKLTPPLSVVQLIEKTQQSNKTVVDAVPNSQVNAPLNIANIETQGQNIPEKDNSNIRDDNAAEVNDGNNAIETDLNFNFISDGKFHETRK